MKKIIPVLMLSLLPYFSNAQDITKAQDTTRKYSKTHIETYIEILYDNNLYRTSDYYEDSISKRVVLERITSQGSDTLFDSDKLNAELSGKKTREEKLNAIDNFEKNYPTLLDVRVRIQECIDIFSLYTNQDYWPLIVKHNQLSEVYGNCISYLTELAFSDLKEKIKEAQEARIKKPGILEQIADMGRQLELTKKTIKDITGEQPLTQDERIYNLYEQQRIHDKYNYSVEDPKFENELDVKRGISFTILEALKETAEEGDYKKRALKFMELVADFPSVAVHPIAIFLAEEFSRYWMTDKCIQFIRQNCSPNLLFEKSNKPDFNYSDWMVLKNNWVLAYTFYDADINLLTKVLGNEQWCANKKDIKEFKQLRISYDPISDKPAILDQSSLNSIRIRVHNNYVSTPEITEYNQMIDYQSRKANEIIENLQIKRNEEKEKREASINSFIVNIRKNVEKMSE